MLSKDYYASRRLETLVENQTSYTLNHAALHVFETHEQAERVLLQFDQPVLASMLRGKKTMHLRNENSFDFLPGESLILPANELMCIDFPEAQINNPTQCLAMAIDDKKIAHVIALMNDTMQRGDEREWQLMDYNFHFTNDRSIYQILQRLLYLFTENHPSKDFFVDNMLQELIVRILQANNRRALTQESQKLSTDSRIAHVILFIQKNLQSPLSIDLLSKQACMSASHFYRVFKNEMGISPTEFINNSRIAKATKMLSDNSVSIKEVYLACGFESRSYFNRLFKRKNKKSPSDFQADH